MFEVSDPSIGSLDRNYDNQNQQLVNRIMGNPSDYNMQGQGGGIVISDSGTYTGNFRWIQFMTDCDIGSIISSNISNAAGFESLAVPAGVGIGGRFTSIQLTSGVAIAYYA